MTQYNTKQGLKCFSKSGVRTIDKEVLQLITMEALYPYYPKELIREDHRAAMAYLMFLKEKQDDTIKAQGYCNRRVQRNYMTKEETSSPTVIQ